MIMQLPLWPTEHVHKWERKVMVNGEVWHQCHGCGAPVRVTR